jgi:hypothetical protein
MEIGLLKILISRFERDIPPPHPPRFVLGKKRFHALLFW